MAKRNLLNSTTTDTVASSPKEKVEVNTTLDSYAPTGRSIAQRDAWIKAIAIKLTNSEVKTILEEADEADQIRKNGPVKVLFGLMNLTKTDQNWTGDKQILLSWPIPGTAEPGVKKEKMIKIPKDKGNSQKLPEWIAVAKSSGEGTNDVSAYRQIFEDMEPGILTNLRHLANASDAKADLTPGNPYGSWSQADRDIHRGRFNSSISNGADRLRKAMAVYFKIHELVEAFGDVITVKLDVAKRKVDDKYTGELYLKSGTIKVIDKENPESSRPFDSTAFLRLNVAKAKKEGGEYIHVIQSGKSTRVPGGVKPSADIINAYKVTDYESDIIKQLHMYEDAAKASSLFKKLKDPDDPSMRITQYELACAMMRPFRDPITGRPTALCKQVEEEMRLIDQADSENANKE
jgi:hypothetical protein